MKLWEKGFKTGKRALKLWERGFKTGKRALKRVSESLGLEKERVIVAGNRRRIIWPVGDYILKKMEDAREMGGYKLHHRRQLKS